jgi:hypothetical protein
VGDAEHALMVSPPVATEEAGVLDGSIGTT